jgi:hypothetical protein
MVTALVAVVLLSVVFGGVWLWARADERPALVLEDVPAEDAHSLFAALVTYLEAGGDITGVIGYGRNAHPSGCNHVYLVTRDTVVAEAEAVLRETA